MQQGYSQIATPEQMQASVTPPAVVNLTATITNHRTGTDGDMALPTPPAATCGVNPQVSDEEGGMGGRGRKRHPGGSKKSLRLVTVSLQEAKAFVAKFHRHHKPPCGHKFSIGVEKDGKLVGVAMCSRPACPQIAEDGRTLEVSRVATDGTKNVCSMLYAACARAAVALGYDKIQTYILVTEHGTSLKASGWLLDKAECGEGRGTRFHLCRRDGLHRQVAGHEAIPKQRWARQLRSPEAPKPG